MKTGELNLLTAGNPAKRIIVFALPLLIGDFLQILYTMTDAFIVGRWLGINGLASVGACYSIIGFVLGFVHGLTGGFAVITAQRVGAGDAQGIRRSVAAGLILCLFASIVITALLLPLSRIILTVMRTPTEIMNDASGYVMVILAGTFAGIFYDMLSGIIRAGGDSFSPLIFLIIATVCNIVLDIVFVVFFSWGVRGAAAATVFSEFISAVLTLRFLVRRFPQFLPRRKDWITARRDFGTHLSLGIAMGLQQSIVEIGNILVQAAINSLGALTIAAVSAAQRVRGLNMMPLFAISRAMTTYTAQNYGAGKMDRVYRGIFQACLISLGLGAFMAALNQFTGAPIVSLFLKDSAEAVALARRFILFTGYTVFILGIMLVFRSSLQGLGMRRAPILCGIMETAMSVLAAFVLIPRLGFTGVCLVNPLSWLASGIPLYIAFGIRKKKILAPGMF
ncbi:MAG: MATE family efflux transporter [Treponema sp.]|jgi:putative MATE family efflux protein|nr:MATE family efflux transporter [Treponema sp.]